MTKKEALTRHKLAQHKPNMNAYVVYASEGQLRQIILSAQPSAFKHVQHAHSANYYTNRLLDFLNPEP